MYIYAHTCLSLSRVKIGFYSPFKSPYVAFLPVQKEPLLASAKAKEPESGRVSLAECCLLVVIALRFYVY